MKTNNIALSDRVYRNGTVASGKIDDLVNSAIARGLSAAELAAEPVAADRTLQALGMLLAAIHPA